MIHNTLGITSTQYLLTKILGLLVLVCSLGSCAKLPTHYWVKFGVSEEQIRRDNFVCADIAAAKRIISPHSGEWFYSAPVDQPAYRQCMTSQGYQLVTEQELKQGVVPVTQQNSWVQMEKNRTLCERVVGEAGDIHSCIRWMSMSPNVNGEN